jgi:hypothetical protein
MLTVGRLRELLHYDPETGIFTWIGRSRGSNIVLGTPAGTSEGSDGYIRIGIDGKQYRAHRLAWLYMTGEWPSEEVDHEHGDRADNRWEKIREATRVQNMRNKTLYKNNFTKMKGVGRIGNKFRARITVDGKTIHLGCYDTKEEASAVYAEASAKFFGEFARVA